MSPQGIGVVPPGGFTYQDDTMPQELEAPGFEELVILLEGYRIANNIPVGDPKGDVLAYIAKRTQIRPNEPAAYQAQITTQQTLRDRVTGWLSERFQGASTGTLRLVTDQEAERRAAICVSCPKNQNWKIGCPPCVSNNERVILMLVQGRYTSVKDKLMGCDACGHDNNAAVMLSKEHLNPERCNDRPSFCWMNDL